jgi:uncharacterized membrane protein YidH (DUF202 family)
VTSEPPDDGEEPDPALAGQRTMLAWTRTAMAFVATGAAITKLRPVAGIPIMIFGALLWPVGRLGRPGRAAGRTRAWLRAVTAAITIVAAFSLLIALSGQHSAGLRP